MLDNSDQQNQPAVIVITLNAQISAEDGEEVPLSERQVKDPTLQPWVQYLKEALERLCAAGLRLKPCKCHFIQQEVSYLGYIISSQGVSVDPEKVRAVKEFPIPLNTKQLHPFLGLASYYRRFIAGFSQIANPLFILTRKDVEYVWNEDCQDAFCIEMYRSSKYEPIQYRTDLLKTLLIPIRYTDIVKWLPYTAIMQHIH